MVQPPRMNEPPFKPPVILGGEHGALPILRALALAGIDRSIVASETHTDSTFHSRHCSRKVLLRSFEPSSDAHNVSLLVSLGTELGYKPVLFWGSDRETLFVNRNRETLSRFYRFILPDTGLTNDLVDKARFDRLAKKHGFLVPRTFIFHSRQQVLDNLHALPVPCTFKPLYKDQWYHSSIKTKYGSYKHALRKISDRNLIIPYLDTLPNLKRGIVAQEFIEGRDEEIVSFHGFFDESGKFVSAFSGRKLRTNPPHFGGSAYVETVHLPELIETGRTICEAIGFMGMVKIDFKRGLPTGRFFLLEFNARFTLWCHLGAFAGLNLPSMWYHHLTGNPYKKEVSYAAGKRWLCLSQDVRSLPSYWRLGEWSAIGAIRSYMAPKIFHTFDWRDPWPFAFSMPHFLRRKYDMWHLRRNARRRQSS